MTTLPVVRLVHDTATRPQWRPWALPERAFAAVLFLTTLPILLVAAVGVRLLSGRSPFVAHRRVGFHGEPLWVYKLRTMWDSRTNAPNELVEYLHDSPFPLPKKKEDPRVTSRFAAFCRRYSIDELPQLWQVVIGDMALVGPRPLTHAELSVYYSGAHDLLSALPGISGLWQIRGRCNLSYAQRRRLDLFLIRNFSPSLYFYILLRTPFHVFTGNGAW